ncbi:hypothetical protein ACWIGY_37780 [Streptomyces anulatus]
MLAAIVARRSSRSRRRVQLALGQAEGRPDLEIASLEGIEPAAFVGELGRQVGQLFLWPGCQPLGCDPYRERQLPAQIGQIVDRLGLRRDPLRTDDPREQGDGLLAALQAEVVEDTVNEFAHGHGKQRCRHQGQSKATAGAPSQSTRLAEQCDPHCDEGQTPGRGLLGQAPSAQFRENHRPGHRHRSRHRSRV